MRRRGLLTGTLAGLVSGAARAGGVSEPFRIPTLDGRAELAGQIELPAGGGRRPLLILVAGTGLFDRHVLFGESGTARDFLFDVLAESLSGAGLAVLRYDQRGVSCHRRDPAFEGSAAGREAAYAARCVDGATRLLVTDATHRDDLLAVRRFGAGHARVDGRAVVLVGASEGSVHAARVVQADPGGQRAVLMLGGILESPAALYHWQRVERVVQWLRQMGPEGGVLTAEMVRAGFGPSPLSSLLPIGPFLPYDGPWTPSRLDALLARMEGQYAAEKAAVLAMPNDAAWPGSGPGPMVQASFGWWKQWFTDTTPVATLYRGFGGRVAGLFGAGDTQVDAGRQRAAAEAAGLAGRFALTVMPGLGHALGLHGLAGPMEPRGVKAVTRAAVDLVQ